MVAIDRWVQQGRPPTSFPMLSRNSDGTLRRDVDGNAIGGLRLPPMTVPVATYTGNSCVLLGHHERFPREKLQAMYPTHADYVSLMTKATRRAVLDGTMLPEDADRFMSVVEATTIPTI